MKFSKPFFLSFILFSVGASGQDSTRLFFNSSIGLLNPLGQFAKSYSISPAVGSGFEYYVNSKYFLTGDLGINAVKYSQQIRDPKSNFLFKNTNSTVFTLGINMGRKIILGPKVFLQPYLGLGYANIGEPRLQVDNTTQIINQEVVRMQGIISKVGNKLALKTKSKMYQTLFLDVSYWRGYFRIQESTPKGINVSVGTKVVIK